MLIIQILILWNSSSSPYMSPVSFDVSSHSPLSFANNYSSLHFISKLHTKLSLFLCIYCASSRKVRVSWAFWLCFPLPCFVLKPLLCFESLSMPSHLHANYLSPRYLPSFPLTNLLLTLTLSFLNVLGQWFCFCVCCIPVWSIKLF